MYLQHFGLTEYPFGITPDTSYVFSATAHQEALNTLLVALDSGEGFVKISGEVGTGKTLLCRRFLASLPGDRFVTAYIPNPLLEPRMLLLAVAEELGIELSKYDYQFHLIKILNEKLLEHASHDRRVVVCIDEAQALPLESLEALRLLSNLETEKRKLMQIVLFGQPELDHKLANPSVRQLRQRIAFAYCLTGLRRGEVDHYLNHRLRVAGYRNPESLFSRGAVRAMHKASGGTPRVVNILAHKALLSAFGEGRSQAKARHVVDAARDTEGLARRLSWLDRLPT
jgi:MSHA biogenesis protein MshM